MIESAVLVLLIAFAVLYVLLNGFMYIGLKRIVPVSARDPQSISIIIAARNEEKNIARCLESAGRQNYPAEKFEIIAVDDRSTDRTAEIIHNLSQKFKNIRLIRITENETDMPNKKNALREAIANSKFDILAFTDADCVLPENWLRQLSDHFTESTGVIAGYSPDITDSLSWTARSFLHFEELLNSLYAAGAIGINRAFMCTGRNFAYRKKVYAEVGGFEKIKHSVSGDDDLFLQLVQKETAWSIRYVPSPQSHVATFPPRSFREFTNQRTRHISAAKFYRADAKGALAVMQLFPVIIFFSFFWFPLTAVVAAAVKINIDAAMIAAGSTAFGETMTFREFMTGELLLPLYSCCIGPIGLVKNFSWKGTASR